jgi:phosphoglycerol transferase
MIGRRWRAPGAAILVRVSVYAGAALAASVVAFFALRLWRADLRVPFSYRGDSVFFAMMVKAVVEHGWYLTNAQLGAPGVLTLHDFPQADAIHLLVIKILSALSGDWALLFNLYFLLGFPLIALSAFAVLRHFRVAGWPAAAVSVLYAFLPSRLLIGELHLYLAVFYQVPLAVLLALWVAGDDPPLWTAGERAWRPRLALRRRRSVVAIGIALLVSGTGAYYAFFAGVLIVVAGVWSAIERRSPRHAAAAAALAALIVGGLAAQSVPTLLYRRANGPNPAVAARPVAEAESYGLKIAPLLLPVSGHRIPTLAAITQRYQSASGTVGEVAATSLGAVGAAGFLILLGILIGRGGVAGDRAPLLAALARLNLAALLFATTGGFGALFALLVSPQIRTYARMHVFIAFFGLFCVALLLDRVWRARPRAGALLTGALAVVGLLDQITPRAVPPYEALARDYRADAAFVHALEAQLPPRAQIFQLPYLRFPESGGLPGTKLTDYDPLRPYLHTRTLRWSYPTMFGRPGDLWTNAVADQPAPELVRTLSDAGFDGILVDRSGYRDDGVSAIAALSGALGPDPVTRTSGTLVFFDLRPENERAFAGLAASERERRRQEALARPVVRWLGGFYPPEQDPDGPFRWCSGDCILEIDSGAPREARVSLSMRVGAARPPARLRVSGDAWTEAFALAPGGTPIMSTLRLPPGRNYLRFRCDGAPAIAPQDPRRLVFRIDDAHLRLLDEAR